MAIETKVDGKVIPDDALLVKITDLAVMLQISLKTVRRRLKAGAIPPPLVLGYHIHRWSRRELESWIGHGCVSAEVWAEMKARRSAAAGAR
jgi:predicted DNA-binding transcriptional regulator AlpA